MLRSLASNALNIVMVLILLLGALAIWGKSQYYNPGPLAEAICIQVDRGSTIRSLSKTLYERQAITNASIFRIGSEYREKSTDLKAGSFLLNKNASMEEITDVVTRGGANTCGSEIVYRIGINLTQIQLREMDPVKNRYETKLSVVSGEETSEQFGVLSKELGVRYRIAIAEGVTSHQVVEALKIIPVLNGEIIDTPAEGSLAPDSYEVQQGDDRQTFIHRMQAAQASYVLEAWESRSKNLPFSSKEDILILASIIEKETGISAERKLVSSVFVNRLKEGMPLQTDPTVIYGITQGKGNLGRGLRKSELLKDTPWNTYVHKGLPPTPIANPGRQSIVAAASPAKSDYIFFVADGSGGHAFANNLKEHNENVAKWRVIEAELKSSD